MRPQFFRARGLTPTFIGLLEGVIILFKALGKVLSLRFEKLCLLISSTTLTCYLHHDGHNQRGSRH